MSSDHTEMIESPPSVAAAERLDALLRSVDVVDLSWSLEEQGPVFPGQQGFQFEKLGDVNDPELPPCFAKLSFMEHIGTHMDAPAHVIDGGRYIDQLPFGDLIAPAFKLD